MRLTSEKGIRRYVIPISEFKPSQVIHNILLSFPECSQIRALALSVRPVTFSMSHDLFRSFGDI